MVGVAGRSKACHTCKRRKIACSLERPRCANCLKSSRVCEGYTRERVFIINTQRSGVGSKATSKQLSCQSRSQLSLVVKKAKTSSVELNHLETPNPTEFDILALKLGDLLPKAAYRQQLFGAFLSSYVPFSQINPAELNKWLMLALNLPASTRALEVSTMALCTARLGHINNDVVLERESLKLYTQGLQELQKALYDPELMYKDDTLGSCMALITYELIASPENTKYAFRSHHGGCLRLVKLRGPNSHISGIGHQLFLNFRALEVLNALEERRTTYLTDATWTNIPWKLTPKTKFDQLLDILLSAPQIFSQVDGFMSLEPHSRLLSVLAIVGQCWELDDRLQKFYADLCAENPGPLYWPGVSNTSYQNEIPCSGGTFRPSFQFPDLGKAKTLMFYWATMTMLWSGLCRLYELLGSLGFDSNWCNADSLTSPASINLAKLPSLEHRADYITVARRVCQSVEYCMQEKMLGLGPQLVIAPLSIVVETLNKEPDFRLETMWAEGVMKRIRERGMRILAYPQQSRIEDH